MWGTHKPACGLGGWDQRGTHLRRKLEPSGSVQRARPSCSGDCLDMSACVTSRPALESQWDELQCWFENPQNAFGFSGFFWDGPEEISHTHPCSLCETNIVCVNNWYMVRAALCCQQEGRRWGGRPTTGEEEALPKANAICRKGMAAGWEPAIVWADVSPPGQPRSSAGEHLGHIARGPGLLPSQRPNSHCREEKKAWLLLSMKREWGLMDSGHFIPSLLHPVMPSLAHLFTYTPQSTVGQ